MNEIITVLRALREEEGLSEFEDMIDQNNIEPHIRTEMYSIVSMLESL